MLTVVTGPPCGGKSTYIRERARADDVVIDLDRIALAFSPEGAEHHDYPGHVRRIAQAARRVAVDEAVTICHGVDVWLIDTMPSLKAASRYAEVGAEVVCCDPGEAVVMARVADQRPEAIRQVALDYYRGTLRAGQRLASPLAW